MRLEQIRDRIEEKGLSFPCVKFHETCILAAKMRNEDRIFRIIDTCRQDNGGIHSLQAFVPRNMTQPGCRISAFIPAAGASSRYTAALMPLIAALSKSDPELIDYERSLLIHAGVRAWPLPPSWHEFLSASVSPTIDFELKKHLLDEMSLPKALMPCAKEGISFLQMKDFEHHQIPGLEGQVYVIPPGLQAAFEENIEQNPLRSRKTSANQLPTLFLEQGKELQTIRFHRDGTPYIEPDGSVSVVPAGHGALSLLFSQVTKKLSSVDALFIRNIDNVNGTSAHVMQYTQDFLCSFQYLSGCFKSIRTALREAKIAEAASIAQGLVEKCGGVKRLPLLREQANTSLCTIGNSDERLLWEFLLCFMHTPLPTNLDLKTLQGLFNRPLNLLGQVPNTNKDVGGSPCFVETPHGIVKVCLEVPHASVFDREKFLADPTLATHFNPVFVIAEIPENPLYYAKFNQDFWLLSEKYYKSEPVVYYETVLYELLGNSLLANAFFVEIPRFLFNPHKAMNDASARTLNSWLQDTVSTN